MVKKLSMKDKVYQSAKLTSCPVSSDDDRVGSYYIQRQGWVVSSFAVLTHLHKLPNKKKKKRKSSPHSESAQLQLSLRARTHVRAGSESCQHQPTNYSWGRTRRNSHPPPASLRNASICFAFLIVNSRFALVNWRNDSGITTKMPLLCRFRVNVINAGTVIKTGSVVFSGSGCIPETVSWVRLLSAEDLWVNNTQVSLAISQVIW